MSLGRGLALTKISGILEPASYNTRGVAMCVVGEAYNNIWLAPMSKEDW